MDSRHLVDPELLAGIDQYPYPGFSHETLPSIRQAIDAFFGDHPVPGDPIVRMDRLTVPDDADGPSPRLIVFQPTTELAETETRPAILHIHGGGYVSGRSEMSAQDNIQLARELECVIVSVDYRLAPENPHPAALEDCYAALRWLHAHATDLRVDRGRIAVSGESAGGGLAAAVALLARDRGEFDICFQHLIYPMVDDRPLTPDSPHPYAGQFVWTADSNAFGWAALLGRAGSAVSKPLIAVAHAEDLVGLPPTFISVGALDLLLEQDMEFARRLIRAGVPTELHVYPGAYHGSHQIVRGAMVSMTAVSDSLRAFRRAFEP